MAGVPGEDLVVVRPPHRVPGRAERDGVVRAGGLTR
ncbi:hypothetical protein LY71_109104 [Geodermatophilus tzadiensis]|uniref:Uncharacterized protein n=1 Tax=Geodermatophilus tzadiensis TaxID=1137988 RepID=A0A2T0TS37_9ACTN|nr:hypothetical protein LY71_109104 [Geodermatophilus tzadiensis]